MEKTETAINEAANSKKRVGGNILSIADRRLLKKAGVNVEKDLKGLSNKQIKKVLKMTKAQNKKRAGVTLRGKKGLGFLGSIAVGAAGFAGGFIAGKALDKAFSIFQTGKKTTGAGFGGFASRGI